MSADGSVSLWINLVKGGDSSALQAIWARYYSKLVTLARRKLAGVRPAVADSEAVAASALNSLWFAAQDGRLPDLAGRDSLWRLLLQMTARKAINLRRREGRERRGGGRVRGESALGGVARNLDRPSDHAINDIIGTEPDPEFAASIAEELQCRLDQLGDGELQQIAVAVMEGYSNQEIAQRLGCAVRTIERRRELIRRKWQRDMSS